MTKVRQGDRVRVVNEGVVAAINDHDPSIFYIGSISRGPVYSDNPGISIEVIERAKPKVGDTIAGEQAYEELPVGTVLETGYFAGNSVLVRTENGFIASDHNYQEWGPRHFSFPRTVVHIPE